MGEKARIEETRTLATDDEGTAVETGGDGEATEEETPADEAAAEEEATEEEPEAEEAE